jgi:hypothetical protein
MRTRISITTILLFIVTIRSFAYDFSKHLISYAYVQHGRFSFINDNPMDGLSYYGDYWFRVLDEGSTNTGPQMAFGKRLWQKDYAIAKISLSGDYYDYNGSKISLTTISPQIGLRHYYV